ncbi:MAG: secretin and TonB N-terminal domain-containing protein, partial [Sphingobacterium sp.]
MKLILVFLVTIFLQQGFSANAQKITIVKKNISLHSILKEIRAQSGYDFFFAEASLVPQKRIDIDVKNEPLEQVLALAFENQSLTYSISGNAIIVKRKIISSLDNTIIQQHVKGKVVDEQNLPLVGVSISVKQSDQSVATDNQGLFS